MSAAVDLPAPSHAVLDAKRTRCCVVGGGPAGMMMGYLLARKGVPVVVLEAHNDFDREFRGDTLHPSILEILDQLGLADRLLAQGHTELRQLTVNTGTRHFVMADFERLRSRYPFIALVPQVEFLNFIAAEARKLPAFQLVMGANVKELIEENGAVAGVRYQSHEGWHEVRAALTVGADGRFSRVRALAGFEPIKTSPPMDILWFSLPRGPGDEQLIKDTFNFIKGSLIVLLARSDHLQLGYIIPKGGYQTLKTQGIEHFRKLLSQAVPGLADRVGALESWNDISPLAVESSRVPRWYRPGLLLIGDAAHVMSPVGGVGINYAFQDAVVASNLLAKPLAKGYLETGDLAQVQRQREAAIRIIQTFQSIIQQTVLRPALKENDGFVPPFFLRLPVARAIVTRMIAYGPRRVHLEQ